MTIRILLFYFLLAFFSNADAQSPSKIELVHANSLEGDEHLGKDVRRLLGDVVFKQEGTFMYCDSAYLYAASNSMDAFGRVRMQQGDTITLTGDVLKYNGNTRLAKLLNNITLRDRKMTLTTNVLNYNLDTGIADYSDGGKIVDAENTLTSKIGNYFSHEKKLTFKKEVSLTHTGYRFETDTLVYFTLTKIANFYGPCFIRADDSSFIYCENGWHNTITEKSFFSKNAFIQNKEQRVKGDSLFYDRRSRTGEAFSNVLLSDSIQQLYISGNYGKFNENTGRSFVTGNILLTLAFQVDSLFMHADTLFATFDSITANKSYFAYHNVRIFKTDLQGACDSLVYSSSDSMMRMFTLPVLWNEKNQLTADSIALQISNASIDKLFLSNSAFITSKEDSTRYNQLRGRNMIGYFQENNLFKIDVFGNGQSIYYARNKKNQLTGVNRADCSNMIILLNDNKIVKLKLIDKPDATFYPINELKADELMLKGFTWQEERRPTHKNDIFRIIKIDQSVY
jgi:lipopolysaccharide export system protein LptA